MVHHGARRCSFCGVRFGRYDDEDYDDRRYPRRGGPRRDCDPHRAGLVLTLGILSLTLPFLCWLAWFAVLPAGLACGITAWILGHNDLRRMREGSMDPDGESSTHGGWVCGIIGTCLSGLLLLSCGSLMGTLYYAGSLPWQQQNQPFRAPPGPRR